MNNLQLIGRTTKDIETSVATSGNKVAKFTLATDGLKKGESYFFDCVAFGKTAEILSSTTKGTKLAIVGSLTQRSYVNQNNVRVNITEIIVNTFDFLSPKGTQKAVIDDLPTPEDDGNEEDNLPF